MIQLTYPDGRKKEFAKTGDFTRITVATPEQAGILTVSCHIPLVDVHAVWVTSLVPGPEKRNLPWVLEQYSGIQKNFPFAATFNISGRNRGCFATTDLVDDTCIRLEINQELGTYDITCTIALSEQSSAFDILLDCRDLDWQQVLEEWRNTVVPEKKQYPAAAQDPVYCTWYAVHGAVTEAFVERTCPVAKELGFTTLIVDDGWSYPEKKRVSPQTISNWYETIGDWEVSTEKFPDFKAHVKRMQDLGMKYMLWVAPHLWGLKSALYHTHPGETMGTPLEGYDKMDVNKADFLPLIQKLRDLAHDNRLDGLKIDFLDIVVPDVHRPNARMTGKLISGLTGALKDADPDVLIEFRQSYATPGMLPYATQFRAGDVPFNWLTNFGRLAELRLSLGNLGIIHADPAYWPQGELCENVARHMMAMLLGVPMISMDLERLSCGEKRIIRYYIDLYNQLRDLIHYGSWHIYFGVSDVEAAVAENDTQRLIVLNDPGRLFRCSAGGNKKTFVLNLTDEALPVSCTSAVDAFCQPVPGDCIPAAGSGILASGC